MDVYYRVLFISTKVDYSKWSRPWWDARKFTLAVKNQTVKGFFHVPQGFFQQKIDINNVGMARRIFGRWMLDAIKAHAPAGAKLSLVPIPSTDAVLGNAGECRHLATVTQSCAPYAHEHRIEDALRFTEQLKKASEGGPRYEDQIYPKLALNGAAPDRPVVLVDDVLTSGGHMKACKRFLEERGAKVLFGIVCGRTIDDVTLDPWQSGKETYGVAADDWLNEPF